MITPIIDFGQPIYGASGHPGYDAISMEYQSPNRKPATPKKKPKPKPTVCKPFNITKVKPKPKPVISPYAEEDGEIRQFKAKDLPAMYREKKISKDVSMLEKASEELPRSESREDLQDEDVAENPFFGDTPGENLGDDDDKPGLDSSLPTTPQKSALTPKRIVRTPTSQKPFSVSTKYRKKLQSPSPAKVMRDEYEKERFKANPVPDFTKLRPQYAIKTTKADMLKEKHLAEERKRILRREIGELEKSKINRRKHEEYAENQRIAALAKEMAIRELKRREIIQQREEAQKALEIVQLKKKQAAHSVFQETVALEELAKIEKVRQYSSNTRVHAQVKHELEEAKQKVNDVLQSKRDRAREEVTREDDYLKRIKVAQDIAERKRKKALFQKTREDEKRLMMTPEERKDVTRPVYQRATHEEVMNECSGFGLGAMSLAELEATRRKQLEEEKKEIEEKQLHVRAEREEKKEELERLHKAIVAQRKLESAEQRLRKQEAKRRVAKAEDKVKKMTNQMLESIDHFSIGQKIMKQRRNKEIDLLKKRIEREKKERA
ncbi:hypothetical protein ADUPG1_000065, partial [Aduncisulcus paluster]